ncbi:hypothetical protein ABZ070_10650 [Streptomyces sp. NPDC006283]|uniref:hypothetical protein n=1 Tax=Streptomyces sp. NPDC006283 TaxID=3156741 RepID=UPI0033BD5E8D
MGAHHELYDAGTCLLHSEFGVEGMANRRIWDAVVPSGAHWPTGRGNPVMEHLGAWWNNTPLVQETFGGRLKDVDSVRRASQQLQYDGLRYAVEANLRRAPRSSGTIPWQFNEPFPNAWCTASVDHRGDPKPAYHGVRRAYRPAHVCAAFATQAWAGRTRFEATVHAWRRDARPGDVTVARIVALDGTVVHESRTGTVSLPTAGLPGPLFLLDLQLMADDGRLVAGNRYVHSTGEDLSGHLDLPTAQVDAAWSPDRASLRLTHVGGPAALGLHVTDARPIDADGWAVFGDNMLDLLPGESLEVPVTWRDAPVEGRAVLLEGWNTDARVLD